MLKKTYNVLHIASFNGNIGDNANHNGFRKMFKESYPGDVHFDEIEMREFYKSWNLRSFESDNFIDTCNNYDLVVIGGGNFFELKWDYSVTGTTVNISNKTLEKIKSPILFNAMGCDIAKGTSTEAVQKFKRFLDYSLESSRIYITLRNDGSYKTIEKLYGKEYAKQINIVPDGAFFMEVNTGRYVEVPTGEKNIGLNVVSDMKEIRFNTAKKDHISYEKYVSNLGKLINEFFTKNQDYNLILFPHIYSDLKAISDLMVYINDPILRRRVRVAPLLTGAESVDYIFGMYQKCQIILGMRFHSNVCAIAQNIPTIGLSSYKKIDDLYEELGLQNRIVHVNQEGFEVKLAEELNKSIENLEGIRESYQKVNDYNFVIGKEFHNKLIKHLINNENKDFSNV